MRLPKWRKHKRAKPVEEHKPCNYLDGDLKCENMIMREKARFGRVRYTLMKYLRAKYGEQTANRAMWRINKRIELDIFTGQDRAEKEAKYLETAKRLLPINELVKEEDKVVDLGNKGTYKRKANGTYEQELL